MYRIKNLKFHLYFWIIGFAVAILSLATLTGLAILIQDSPWPIFVCYSVAHLLVGNAKNSMLPPVHQLMQTHVVSKHGLSRFFMNCSSSLSCLLLIFVTTNLRYTLRLISFFMNTPSTWRLIVIWCVKSFSNILSPLTILPFMNNQLNFLPLQQMPTVPALWVC